ncbi:MAG: hypothetical protein KGO03_12230 [Gemmatimonadota bacterium]|nr:hypothetical protein [Gemmatimonadota bacterium]
MTIMTPSKMTLQEYFTTLPPDEVLARARQFFVQRNSLYAAFPDRSGDRWASFRGQGGEEVIVAAASAEGGTRVTGSSYLFTMQLMRFFTTLPELERPAEVA